MQATVDEAQGQEQGARAGVPLDVEGPEAAPVGFSYSDLRALGVHGRAFNETAPGQYYSRLPAAAQKDVTAMF